MGLPAGLQLDASLHLPGPLLALPRGRRLESAVLAVRAARPRRLHPA